MNWSNMLVVILERAIKRIYSLKNSIAAAIKFLWASVVQFILTVVSTVVGAINTVIKSILNAILGSVRFVVKKGILPIIGLFRYILSSIMGLILGVLKLIGKIGSAIRRTLAYAKSLVFGFIFAVTSAIVGVITTVAKSIRKAIVESLKFVIRCIIKGLLLIQRIYRTIVNSIRAVRGGIHNIKTTIRSAIRRQWENAKSFVYNAILSAYERAINLRKATVVVMSKIADWVMDIYKNSKVIARRTKEAINESPELEMSQRLDRLAYGMFERLWRDTSRYARYDRQVKMARFNEGYDVYLSRSTFYSITTGFLGAAIGIIVAFAVAPILIQYDYSVEIPYVIGNFLQQNAELIVIPFISSVIGIMIFAITAGILYYRPIYIAGERGRAIDKTLPHAITFMYALSRGGMNVLEVVREISTAKDTYGEAAEEFAAIRRKVDRTNTDLNAAVREVANNTPSDNLKNFLEDFLSIIDSGSNPENFFLDKSKTYLEKSRETQKQTLQTLEIFSEMYVILFVVSPIFVLIIQMVMGLLGNVDSTVLGAVPVGVLVGAGLFTAIIYMLSSSSEIDNFKLEKETHEGVKPYEKEKARDDPRALSYKWANRYKKSLGSAAKPLSLLRKNPPYSLALTIPIALVFIAYAAYSGIVGTELSAFNEAQLWTTFIYIYIPLVIVMLPLSILHELSKRRESQIIQRLHDLFKQAAEANRRGLTLEESIRVATENSTDALATELEKSMNRSSWTGNLNGSLVKFANKMRVPRLSRTIKLISKANASSGDVQAVLTVAANDLEATYKLDKERKQNALQHIIVIVISFLIGIGVIVMLDISFLSIVEDQVAHSGGGTSGVSGFGQGINIPEFRRVVLHTTMALGLGSGIVAGTMANNDPLKGLKYSLVLMTIPLVIFVVF